MTTTTPDPIEWWREHLSDCEGYDTAYVARLETPPPTRFPAQPGARLRHRLRLMVLNWIAADTCALWTGQILHRAVLERIVLRAREEDAVSCSIEWPDGKRTKLW